MLREKKNTLSKLFSINFLVIFLLLISVSLQTGGTLGQQLEIQVQQDVQNLPRKIYVSNTKSISLRLRPNQDIMTTITSLLEGHHFTALSIVSGVGSVNYCWIRFANQSFFTKIDGPLQITSLTGTLDKNLSPHIHISVANGNGTAFGGHLPSLQQRKQSLNFDDKKQAKDSFFCPIFTTLQLVLLSHEDIIYQRKIDAETTFHQLTIRKRHFWS